MVLRPGNPSQNAPRHAAVARRNLFEPAPIPHLNTEEKTASGRRKKLGLVTSLHVSNVQFSFQRISECLNTGGSVLNYTAELMLNNRSKGQVIRVTFSFKLSRNIAALQVEKRCCPYHHRALNLPRNKFQCCKLKKNCCKK